jgi:hypothetical protein
MRASIIRQKIRYQISASGGLKQPSQLYKVLSPEQEFQHSKPTQAPSVNKLIRNYRQFATQGIRSVSISKAANKPRCDTEVYRDLPR